MRLDATWVGIELWYNCFIAHHTESSGGQIKDYGQIVELLSIV